MNIKLVCVGNLKDQSLKQLQNEFTKRLQAYCKLEIIEVDDIKGDNLTVIVEKESIFISKHIGEKDYVITLEIDGKQFTSEDLSTKIENLQMEHSNIVFVIGGSYGLSNTIKQRSNLSISFSKLTFPHPLFRVIFLEQLYRAYKIMHNETYHK